ncbi:hypothetical protein BU26DRAFT_404835, partial [Trematosphaeria pertusa]
MSYLLQFPLRPLPENARSPPFVLFGINGAEIFDSLPTNISLALVLHFAPKLRTWLLPAPDLSSASASLALRTPYIGINILADIDVEGLAWILSRMLQLSGAPVLKEACLTHPSLLTAISIHRAWTALELPASGIQALHLHMVTKLMLGLAVCPAEIKAIWNTFPVDSPITREMGLNFIRSHINYEYTQAEFSSIRHWYLASRERTHFFKSLEARFPEF